MLLKLPLITVLSVSVSYTVPPYHPTFFLPPPAQLCLLVPEDQGMCTAVNRTFFICLGWSRICGGFVMRLFIMGCVNHEGSERARLCFRACLCPAQQPSQRIFLYSCTAEFWFSTKTMAQVCHFVIHNILFSTSKSLAVGGGRDKAPASSKWLWGKISASQPDDLRNRPSYKLSGLTTVSPR